MRPESPLPERQLSRRTAALVPAVTALAIGLWGIRRGGTLWGDEAVTYEIAHRSVPEIWHTLANADVVHGLYYFLMHAVFALWDGDLVALRLPSILATAAAAGAVALLGHRLAGPRAGLLAGLVLPLLPNVQRFAQEGRSYALVCALVAWGTCLLLDACDDGLSGKRAWAGYAAAMLGACLLHEFAVLALLAHGVTVWRSGLSRPVVRAWGTAAGSVAVGLAPLALFSATQSAQVDWIGDPGAYELLVFAATALLGLACARVPTRPHGPIRLHSLALPLLVLPTALLMLLSPLRQLYVDRYVLFTAIGLALLAGAVLDRFWRPTVAAATAVGALVALLPVGLELRVPESRKNDVFAVARAVREAGEPGDGLLFTPARRRVWTLAAPDDFRGLEDLSLERSPVASNTLFGAELPPDLIRARMLAAQRIVVVHDVSGQPLDAIEQEAVKRAVLRAHFEACGTSRVTQAQITVYARPGAC
ncbi:glycosyltransferase family 39 protein [Streptomyces sp. 21So2-11]|uniref:glycosyltransferase family 39 protein n=1 Tax=Streptomyces sp. 21So2-11 TaxID=3144408 RepID=UPI00321B97D0